MYIYYGPDDKEGSAYCFKYESNAQRKQLERDWNFMVKPLIRNNLYKIIYRGMFWVGMIAAVVSSYFSLIDLVIIFGILSLLGLLSDLGRHETVKQRREFLNKMMRIANAKVKSNR